MNRYGKLLQRQWEIANPTFVQSLESPEQHFANLGEQVQEQVLAMLPALEGADPAGETYLQKVARLQAARSQAEEVVLSDFQPPSDSPDPGEPEGWDEMSHDDQETWIRQNVQPGEQQQEMLTALEGRRLTREILMGGFQPEDEPED